MAENMYRIRLQAFEGPLDLLLFFIKRDELDIYNIPIAQITDEYLAYVRVLEEIDLDGVGDFIYMASLLISIKARMLLPQPETGEDEEPVDPRRELVERLLEYMRFKEAAHELETVHERRADLFTRGAASSERESFEDEGEILVNTSVFDLIASLRHVLTEVPQEPTHQVEAFEYTVEEQRAFVQAQLAVQERISFVELVRQRPKSFIIATFLAVLEMALAGEVGLSLTETTEDFYVERVDEGEDKAVPSNGQEH